MAPAAARFSILAHHVHSRLRDVDLAFGMLDGGGNGIVRLSAPGAVGLFTSRLTVSDRPALLQQTQQPPHLADVQAGRLHKVRRRRRSLLLPQEAEQLTEGIVIRSVCGEESAQSQIFGPVVQERERVPAITSGAAYLLVIAVHRLGNISVQYEADVGLVNPHAKRASGHDHIKVTVQETLVHVFPDPFAQARVVRLRAKTRPAQASCVVLSLPAGGDIKDPRGR